MTYRYSLTSVDQDRRALAMIAANLFARDLQMQVPRIYFFDVDPTGGIRSPHDLAEYSMPISHHIAIRACLSPAELFRTTAHECRHLWQSQRSEWRSRGDDLLERDARLYVAGWGPMLKTLGFRELTELICRVQLGALEGRDIQWRSDAHDTAGRVKVVVVCDCPEAACIHERQPRK
jgi:hypothetical protein